MVRPAAPVKEEEALLPGVKNVVVIASGKGGVGKSTITTNLAVALAAEAIEGLLDGYFWSFHSQDVGYGRSQAGHGEYFWDATNHSRRKYGLKVLSIGFLYKRECHRLAWPYGLQCPETIDRRYLLGELIISSQTCPQCPAIFILLWYRI